MPNCDMNTADAIALARDLQTQVDTLISAIRKHYDTFVDEPLSGEYELWSYAGIELGQYHGPDDHK
jgi:hypothetical protein